MMGKMFVLLMCLPTLGGWFERERVIKRQPIFPTIKHSVLETGVAQTQTGAAEASKRVRVGLARINNKTKSSVSADELRERLMNDLNSSGIEAVPLNASSLNEAQIEAHAKQCDYILLTDISTLKDSSGRKILSSILTQTTGVNAGISTKSEARLDFRLFSTGSSSATIESSATAKEDTKEATLTAALNQEVKAVVAHVKPAPQMQQAATPSGPEASQPQGDAATISAGRQSGASPRAPAATNFSGTWVMDKASLDKAKSQRLQVIGDSWVESITWTITQDEKTISIKQNATRKHYGDTDFMAWPLLQEPFNFDGVNKGTADVKRQAIWSGRTLQLTYLYFSRRLGGRQVLTGANSLKLSISDDGKVLTALLHDGVESHAQGWREDNPTATLVFSKATRTQQAVTLSGRETSRAQDVTAPPPAEDLPATPDASPTQGGNQSATVSGQWREGDDPRRNNTLTLRVEGTKLTGTWRSTIRFNVIHQIYDGQVHGNNISFNIVSRPGTEYEVTTTFRGIVSGDELKIAGTYRVRQEGYRLPEQTFRRVKEEGSPTSNAAQEPSATLSAGETPAASTVSSTPSANQATSASGIHADLSKDPRLQRLLPELRQEVLKEAESAVLACKGSVMLMNFYDCSCYSKRMFDARLKTFIPDSRGRSPGFQISFGSLSMDLSLAKDGMSECVAPSKIVKYGYDRSMATLVREKISDDRRKRISECVGSGLATGFKAKPAASMGYVDGLFNSVLAGCYER